MSEKNWYTVIGYYEEDDQKYFDFVLIETPAQAERCAEEIGVSVVAVLDGKHRPVDESNFVNVIVDES